MRVLFAILISAAAMPAQNAGIISGVVRSSTTHRPLDGAQASLIGEESTGTQTDVRGAFHFAGLPEGKYTLRVEKPGYSSPKPREIAVGAEPVIVELDPLAQIEGRILDEDGNAAPGVTAEAIFPAYAVRGYPWLRGPTTERDGRFLLSNLKFGDYWIRLSIPEALRAQGYPAMEYYPGVTDPATAATIHLTEGQQMTGLNIRLRRVPLVRFHGHVVDLGKDEAARPVEVASDCDPGPNEGSFARHPLDAEGRFHFHGATPGHHQVLIYRGTEADDLPYATSVNVGKDEATVTVPPFANLMGVVKSTAKVPWEGVLGIGLGANGAWRRNVLPGEDGTFTLPNVPPGEWLVKIESNGLQAAGQRLLVASARFGDTNVIAEPITVSEGLNPSIVIQLTDESGSIAGVVEEAEPKDEALVVAQPMDGRPIAAGSFADAKPDGSFTMGDLLPGDYEVMAWSKTPLRKSGFGGDCTDHAVKITVTNGQTATVKLKRCEQ